MDLNIIANDVTISTKMQNAVTYCAYTDSVVIGVHMQAVHPR